MPRLAPLAILLALLASAAARADGGAGPHPPIDPDAWALYLRANHLSNEGRCAEALDLYGQVQLLSPTFSDVLLARAPCLLATGQRESARESLQEYLAHDFPGKDAAAARERLRALDGGGPGGTAAPSRLPPREAARVRLGLGGGGEWVGRPRIGPGRVEARVEGAVSIRLVGPLEIDARAVVGLHPPDAPGGAVEAGPRLAVGLALAGGTGKVRPRGGVAGGLAFRAGALLPAVTGFAGVVLGPGRPGTPFLALEAEGGLLGDGPVVGGAVRVGISL